MTCLTLNRLQSLMVRRETSIQTKSENFVQIIILCCNVCYSGNFNNLFDQISVEIFVVVVRKDSTRKWRFQMKFHFGFSELLMRLFYYIHLGCGKNISSNMRIEPRSFRL